jgi:nucleotidyltransferase/DNA polymerase involved in DNA repair
MLFKALDSRRFDDYAFVLRVYVEASALWGIGRQLTKRLETQGITTALQLQEADIALIKQLLGVVGVRTVLEMPGLPCLPLELCVRVAAFHGALGDLWSP